MDGLRALLVDSWELLQSLKFYENMKSVLYTWSWPCILIQLQNSFTDEVIFKAALIYPENAYIGATKGMNEVILLLEYFVSFENSKFFKEHSLPSC